MQEELSFVLLKTGCLIYVFVIYRQQIRGLLGQSIHMSQKLKVIVKKRALVIRNWDWVISVLGLSSKGMHYVSWRMASHWYLSCVFCHMI